MTTYNSVNLEYWNKLVRFRNNIDDVIQAKELLEVAEGHQDVTIIDKKAYFEQLTLNQLKTLVAKVNKNIIRLTKKDKELGKAMMKGLLVRAWKKW